MSVAFENTNAPDSVPLSHTSSKTSHQDAPDVLHEEKIPPLTTLTANSPLPKLGNVEKIINSNVGDSGSKIDSSWETDPDNPRNWSSTKKWVAVSIVSLYTFTAPISSSMMASGLPEVSEKYHITSPTIEALTLSIFLLSFGIGPLILSPLSEIYGRTWILHIANIFTFGFNLGSAYAPNTGTLIGLRFLTGFSGSAPIGISMGSIRDLFDEKDRAAAMAIISLGPLAGPVLGPVAGGFVAEKIGVKWIFIIISLVCALASIVGIPFLRETYAPVIRLRRIKRNKDFEKVTEDHEELLEDQTEFSDIWHNLTRPFILLVKSHVCFMLSLYMAFMYGIFYLMFTTFAGFFSATYGFNPGISGLTYLGLGVGFIGASAFGAKVADKIYKHLAKKNGGVGTPEMRIPALIFGSLFVPVGLFWYGWSAQAKTHWIMPIIGSAIFGFGMMTACLPIQLYLVDAFTFSASAMAAASIFRCVLGFAFPLFGEQMYNRLGLGGGNSLLAGFAIVLGIPFPIWLYFNGAEIRAKSSLTR